MSTEQALSVILEWRLGKREYDSVTVFAIRILRGF